MSTINKEGNCEITQKILHTLSIYPKISPSMLQISLNLAASKWKPILEHLIQIHKIKRSVIVAPTPTGRHQSHTVLELAPIFTKPTLVGVSE